MLGLSVTLSKTIKCSYAVCRYVSCAKLKPFDFYRDKALLQQGV
jgi:hypothetical protein